VPDERSAAHRWSLPGKLRYRARAVSETAAIATGVDAALAAHSRCCAHQLLAHLAT
jgi:hypothetical protein